MLSFFARLVVAGALMAVMTAGPAVARQNSGPNLSDPVVARVNGKDITKKNVDGVTSTLIPMMSYHSSVSDERFRGIQRKALNSIIDDLLIYEHSKDIKLDKTSKKEFKKEMDRIRKSVPRGQKLDDILKRGGMTMADLEEEVRYMIVIKKVRKEKMDEFRKKSEEMVNDAYMRNYYKKNLGKFKEPEKIRISEILIKADPAGGQKAWNEVKKKALEIKKRAVAGEDFAGLAREVSEDVYAEKGGDMGWTHRGSIAPELEEAAEPLKTGEIAGPIMTIYGFHVVKLTGKRPPVQKKYEDLNLDNLRNELRAKEYRRLWDGWIKGLRKGAKIEYLSERFKPKPEK